MKRSTYDNGATLADYLDQKTDSTEKWLFIAAIALAIFVLMGR